jgi:hypothetical protein
MEEAEAGWGPVAIRDSEHVNDLGVCSDRHLGEARDKVPLRTLLHFKSGRRGLQEEGGREGGRLLISSPGEKIVDLFVVDLQDVDLWRGEEQATRGRGTMMVSIHSSLRCCDFSNNSSRARVLTPRWSGGPVMVKVFLERCLRGTGTGRRREGRVLPAPCLAISKDANIVSIQDTGDEIRHLSVDLRLGGV